MAQHLPGENDLANDEGADIDLYQCGGCGVVQLDSAPVPYYREVIRATGVSPEMLGFRQEQLKKWVDEYQLQGKTVLEPGCGHGEFLTLLNEAGADAHGLEWAEAGVAACAAAGVSVERDYVEDADKVISGAPFAAFACFNFMEHWPDPVAALRGIGNNLTPGAVGLVEVPNLDMILSRGLFSEFISDHLFYFTKDTFSLTLQLAGFEVLQCRPVWHDYILSAEVRLREPLSMDLLEQRREMISDALQNFISRHPPQQVAVWGAGHQALAVLALADISSDIRYVVDSAPFKQGRYTPASHLPIVPPKMLEDDPVKAVIVMAASYSDEVARILRKSHGEDIQIAVLRDNGLEEA